MADAKLLQGHPLGALWGFRIHGGRGADLGFGPLDSELTDPHGWLWLHFALSDQRARDFLDRFSAAPAEARALLQSSDPQPQIHLSGAWTYGVLPDYERDLEGRSTSHGRLRFAFDDRRLLTARRHSLLVIDKLRHAVAEGFGLPSPKDALIAHIHRYCEAAEDQLDETTAALDHAEDQVLGDHRALEEINLGPVRRELSRCHREFSMLRVALSRAGARHADCVLTRDLPALIQRTEDVDREIVTLQDRARLLHEEIDTKMTSATNRTLRTLTVISTLLLPPTVIVGAFGMNLKGIPFESGNTGFWAACGVCAITVGAAYALLRRMDVL
jgi:Mg2+ and Co2+ transporter CorA